MKLVSRKDGSTGDRGSTFVSYCPNTYDVVDDAGAVVGIFTKYKAPHPRYGTRCELWNGTFENGETVRFSYLNDARSWVAGLDTGWL